jgi:hypothetical protein
MGFAIMKIRFGGLVSESGRSVLITRSNLVPAMLKGVAPLRRRLLESAVEFQLPLTNKDVLAQMGSFQFAPGYASRDGNA